MRQDSSCPDKPRLERLRDGSLGLQEQRAVEKHCETCEACQAALEELAYDGQGNPRPIRCPGVEVLKRLLDGSLGDCASEAVEYHAYTCKSCENDVSALSSGFEPGSYDAICAGFGPIEQSTRCPEPVVLRRLVEGSIARNEQKEIERHLETCEACQAKLDGIASGGLILQGQMRSLRPDPAADAPGLKRVMGALKDELNPDGDRTASTVSPSAAELGFLDPSETPGELGTLGPYHVLDVLGHGGMGIVMKAFDPTLHRTVAIKILAPQLAASSSARQRFAREARAAAAIRNEHVVAIHSVDEWKGLPYLVMEFIPGSSLQARIDRTAPLDLNSILRIGLQAATGLAAAHAQGLVHRDIKPSNILLENCVERVKISDFGLARAVDDASLTQSGVVAGTPLFMAPEQARCETIDHRADLFSLGAVLYAMCTGRSPFRASTTLGVLRRVCDDHHRPVQEVNPDVPNWLSQIIDKLLAKDREERHQTAEEVVEVLGRHLARRQRGITENSEKHAGFQSKAVVPVDDVGPAKEHPRRRRWLEIIGALLVALAGLFVVAEAVWDKTSLPPLPELLGLRRPKGLINIRMPYPEPRVLLNGRRLVPGNAIQMKPMAPGGYVIEVFRGRERTASRWFELKAGMMVELKVLDDGSINFEYDGPIRLPANH